MYGVGIHLLTVIKFFCKIATASIRVNGKLRVFSINVGEAEVYEVILIICSMYTKVV